MWGLGTMKKYLLIIFASLLILSACGSDDAVKDEKEVDTDEVEETEGIVENDELDVDETETEEVVEEVEEETVEQTIDTSMYEYSKDVKVTDAIDLNDYVSLIIEMNDNLEPGLAFQHATNQTYDFLQQDAINGAKKVGINIILNDRKIAMYEVDLNELKINDDEPMAQLVLDASVVEVMVPEVKEYAEVMELEYKEE